MIQREMRLLVTFRTTEGAMAMEEFCRAAGADGRLIPVPRQITAGCGLAWSAKPESRPLLESLMQANGLEPQDMQFCMV